MKLLFLGLVLTLTLSIASYAQTTVGGPYFSNITWNISGSPYTLTSDVQLPEGVVLTIEPDVIVNFSGDFEILVQGIIIANGNNTSPIIFNGDNGTNDHSMINFDDNNNLSASLISYIIFFGTQSAIKLDGENSVSDTLHVLNSTFNNASIYNYGYDSRIFEISNSSFTDSDIRKDGREIKVFNSDFENGTIYSNSNSNFYIENCNINNSLIHLDYNNSKVEIVESNLQNIEVFDYGNAIYSTLFILRNSHINGIQLALDYNSVVEMYNSRIEFDIINPFVFETGVIECCEIAGNNEGTALKINKDLQLNNSTISDCSIGIEITDMVNTSITIDSCNFYNYNLFAIKNYSDQVVTANNNWWNRLDSTSIANIIYDYYNNINSGIVNFSNYLITPDTHCVDNPTLYEIVETAKNTIILYPNPSTGIINIDGRTILQVEIYNTSGVLIKSTTNNKIDISKQAKGVYLVKIVTKKGTITKKIIIE